MVKKRLWQSVTGTTLSWAFAAIITAACLFVILYVLFTGASTVSWRFLTTEPDPSALNAQNGGILTPLIGTLLLTFIGMVIAWPCALSTAIYLVFYAKKGKLTQGIRTAIDILAGIPTIVVALFALSIFTRPFMAFLSVPVELGDGQVLKAYGRSFLVAGLTMAIMVLPFVTKTAEEALKAVPQSFIEASKALGASHWYTITKMVLIAAKQGLATAVILGMGRIIGDTAIVWLTLGGTLRMTGLQPWYQPNHWLSTLQNTGCTLTSYIFYTSPAGEGNSATVAFGASFVLILMILVLNGFAGWMGASQSKPDR